jgi:hypothetical protein
MLSVRNYCLYMAFFLFAWVAGVDGYVNVLGDFGSLCQGGRRSLGQPMA